MFYFSAPKQASYALHFLSYLVRHLAHPPVSLATVSRSEGIPRSSLSAIAVRLEEAGLIKPCTERPNTYCLSRSPEEITLLEMFEGITDGPLFVDCCLRSCPLSDQHDHSCRIKSIWEETISDLRQRLAHTSLSDAAWDHPIHRLNV